MNWYWPAEWLRREESSAPPSRMTGTVRTVQWAQFAEQVREGQRAFVMGLVAQLWRGDALLLKGVFSPEFMRELREAIAGDRLAAYVAQFRADRSKQPAP